ncbi:MAG: hypothetical protein ACK41F_04610 [Fimbriimonadaceae bacterium]
MVRWLEAAVRAAGCGGMLADQPEHADAILLFSGHAGPDALRFAALFDHLCRRHPGRTFPYHDGDYAVPLLPGLYPSLLGRHHRTRMGRGGALLRHVGREEGGEPAAFGPGVVGGGFAGVSAITRKCFKTPRRAS